MAHPGEKRTQLRGLYVFQRLPMETACKKLGVPRSTGNRWKQEAADKGDDWDSVRAAMALGDDNFASLSKKLLEDYLVQHQATMDLLRNETLYVQFLTYGNGHIWADLHTGTVRTR